MNRKFSQHDPWGGDDDSDFIKSARRLQKNYDELLAEFERIANELAAEKARREAETARADDAIAVLAEAQMLAEHYKSQNLLLVSKMSGLVTAINGALPNAGTAILAAFKNIGNLTRLQIEEMKDLVKEHTAANAEAAKSYRERAEQLRPGRQLTQEIVGALEQGKEEAEFNRGSTFDAVTEKLEAEIRALHPVDENSRSAVHQEVREELQRGAMAMDSKEPAAIIPDAQKRLFEKPKTIGERLTETFGRK